MYDIPTENCEIDTGAPFVKKLQKRAIADVKEEF